MTPSETLPAEVGFVFEDCFDVYVGGECLSVREAFVRHPGAMAIRVARQYWPMILTILVIVGLPLAYRRWKKVRSKESETHVAAKP